MLSFAQLRRICGEKKINIVDFCRFPTTYYALRNCVGFAQRKNRFY